MTKEISLTDIETFVNETTPAWVDQFTKNKIIEATEQYLDYNYLDIINRLNDEVADAYKQADRHFRALQVIATRKAEQGGAIRTVDINIAWDRSVIIGQYAKIALCAHSISSDMMTNAFLLWKQACKATETNIEETPRVLKECSEAATKISEKFTKVKEITFSARQLVKYIADCDKEIDEEEITAAQQAYENEKTDE